MPAQAGKRIIRCRRQRFQSGSRIWPRATRRFWYVVPMARSIRDLALAFSQLDSVKQHGQDNYMNAPDALAFLVLRFDRIGCSFICGLFAASCAAGPDEIR